MITLVADICIVGSGPAGGILAVELAKEGIDVLLIEAGNDEALFEAESLVDSLDIGGRTDLRFGMSRQLGGASNLWSGRCAPFDELDFKARDWVPESGWPFSREALTPYYRRAAVILGLPGYDLFLEQPSAKKGEVPISFSNVLGGGIETKGFQWAKTPFKVADYLKQAAQEHPSLRILEDASVTSLRESKDAGTIEYAEVLGSENSVRRVHAKIFILAAGGLETPRILLASRDVSPTGIGNQNDCVGRYFSTHPKADMAMLILKKPIATSSPLVSDQIDRAGLRYGIGFDERTQEDNLLLNHYVQILPVLEYQANRLFETIKGSAIMTSSLIDRNRLVRGMLPGFGLMAYEAIGRVAGLQRKAKKFILRAFLDQYPSRENRVTLSEARDERGIQKINIRWRLSDADQDSVLRFFEELKEKITASGIGDVDFSRLETQKEWPLTGIHSHFMGTTRMGSDPRSSVTDGNCQVHGVGNLYIAGPSLFPTYGFANPFFTISALSLRLADHLKNRLGVGGAPC